MIPSALIPRQTYLYNNQDIIFLNKDRNDYYYFIVTAFEPLLALTSHEVQQEVTFNSTPSVEPDMPFN